MLGRVTNEQFRMLSSDYNAEQKELESAIPAKEEQLERLKALVGKSTGSEALKYVMKEYPRFCAHYREEAKQRREREQEFTEMRRALCGYVEALQRLQAVALRE